MMIIFLNTGPTLKWSSCFGTTLSWFWCRSMNTVRGYCRDRQIVLYNVRIAPTCFPTAIYYLLFCQSTRCIGIEDVSLSTFPATLWYSYRSGHIQCITEEMFSGERLFFEEMGITPNNFVLAILNSIRLYFKFD